MRCMKLSNLWLPAIAVLLGTLTVRSAAARTVITTGNTRWEYLNITKSDTLIVSKGDTVTADLGDYYGDCQCSMIRMEGVLQFGTDAYNEPGKLIVFGTLLNFGLITPSLDTSFSQSEGFQMAIVDGQFANNGVFVWKVQNGGGTANESIYVGFSGSSSLSTARNIYIGDLSINGPTVLSGVVYCRLLYLYNRLERNSGTLVIDDGGTIFRNDSGSIAFPPVFNPYVNISYGTSGELVTGPELDSVVTNLTFAGDIILTKSVTVTGSIGRDKFSNSSRNYIHTGPNTLTIPQGVAMNDLGVDGNLARIYTSTGSLVFPLIGDEVPIIVGSGFVPDSLGSFVPRPIAIRLNNLKAGPDTITAAFHNTHMKAASLPQGVVALDRLHFWSVSASPDYAGNVDADVSLTWYDDMTFPGLVFRRDYINARSQATVLHGNFLTGVWDEADSSGGKSDQAFGADEVVTGRSFKSFGDFTVGELAGIPNGNFEDWTSFGLYSWTTNNSYGQGFITESKDAYSGSAAVMGQTIPDTGSALCPKLKLLLPTREVPGALEGYFRFAPSGNDRFVVLVKAYKQSEVVAQGTFVDSAAVDSYHVFQVNINPVAGKSDSLSDSLTIEVTLLPGDSARFHDGTTFLVDDLSFGNVTAVSSGRLQVPSEFKLYQNFPNPFNPTTTILYSVPRRAAVTLIVYDVLGRKVATLVDGTKSKGEYRVEFNASRFASGVYFYRLKAGSYTRVRKLLLLK